MSVDRDHAIPRILRHVDNRQRRVADAGVVHQHVEPAEAPDRGIEEALHVGARADVALHRDALRTWNFGLEQRRRLVEMRLFDVDERQLRAFAGEAQRHAAADATSAAGDQCDAVL